MNSFKKITMTVVMASMVALSGLTAFAQDVTNALVGVQGYDLVTYQTRKAPLHGNGNYLSVYKGVTYEFIGPETKQVFDASPEKYVPAFNGYCAFGVSVGKKFIGDPLVWKVVDNRLYLNLDQGIRDTWIQDIPGNLEKANANWPKIINKNPADL